MRFYGDTLPAWQAAVRGDLQIKHGSFRKTRVADATTEAVLSYLAKNPRFASEMYVRQPDAGDAFAYVEERVYGFGLSAVLMQIFLGWLVRRVFNMIWEYWSTTMPGECSYTSYNPQDVLMYFDHEEDCFEC